MKKSINININKDDQNVNDYLYARSLFDEGTCKSVIFHNFDCEKFCNIINKFQGKVINTLTEIYPTESQNLENVKKLVKLTEDVLVSFIIYDATSDEGFIGDVYFLYKIDSQPIVDELLSELESSIKNLALTDEMDHSFFTISLENTGYELKPIDYLDGDYENIEYYFNDETLKSSKKLIKKLNSSNKGISIMYGARGTGKSTLSSYILQLTDRKKVFIPNTMVETTVNSPEFRNFLNKNKNIILILDDFESIMSEFISKTSNVIKNLLQLIDSLDSDNLMIQILLIINVDDLEELDDTLLESNNLLEIIQVENLKINKSKELVKFLKKNKKIKNDTKLIDILKKKISTKSNSEIGF